MILHTIISEDDIFSVENSNNIDNKNDGITQYLNIAGGRIEYNINNGQKQVVRLFSTDPSLYLKDEYTPFTLFK